VDAAGALWRGIAVPRMGIAARLRLLIEEHEVWPSDDPLHRPSERLVVAKTVAIA